LDARKARRKKRGKKKSKGDKAKTTYHPGAFGLSCKPDVDIDGVTEFKKQKVSTVKKKR